MIAARQNPIASFRTSTNMASGHGFKVPTVPSPHPNTQRKSLPLNMNNTRVIGNTSVSGEKRPAVKHDTSIKKWKQETFVIKRHVTEESKMAQAEVTIFFVTKTCEATASSYMRSSFNMISQMNFAARGSMSWITEAYLNDCLQSPTKRPQVVGFYVLESMEGDLFNRLCDRMAEDPRCRVCGPLVLLQSADQKLIIPKINIPLLSMSFDHMIVICSGFSQEEKKDIEHKIIRMGGTFSGPFRDDATHLICESINGAKPRVARNRGLPLMTKAWVDDIWKTSSKNILIKAKERVEKYRLQVFAGCILTSSQVCVNYSCLNLLTSFL